MHNPKLADKLGVSKENRDLIDAIHKRLDKIVRKPEEVCSPVEKIEILEYKLQRLWSFSETRSHHTWWIKIAGCTCPELDNRDYFGLDLRVTNGNCPWHGGRL